jgi:3-oxoacyl-[acyl-carrier-protein] synthase-3
MAFLEVKNIRIAGMSAGVPQKVVCNLDIKNVSKDYDAASFVEVTGVKERHFDELTVSDLAVPAANRLIDDLGWQKSDIDGLIVVTQHGDYIVPATSCIIQDLLGLTKECLALDISLGCSGWVYGLSAVASMMAGGMIKKCLLISGDARRRVEFDDPLFGYAATVTALEYVEGEEGFKFHLGTDGSGYDAIIIPDGGARNQITDSSFVPQEVDGRYYTPLQSRMKGMDVFSFGITTAPKSVKKLAEHFGFDYLSYDYLVLHQANMKMNNMIAKKLKFEDSKVPSSMWDYGNTSSASIPLTIVARLKEAASQQSINVLCCGFGVGLSWGTVALNLNHIVVPDIVEVNQKVEKQWV